MKNKAVKYRIYPNIEQAIPILLLILLLFTTPVLAVSNYPYSSPLNKYIEEQAKSFNTEEINIIEFSQNRGTWDITDFILYHPMYFYIDTEKTNTWTYETTLACIQLKYKLSPEQTKTAQTKVNKQINKIVKKAKKKKTKKAQIKIVNNELKKLIKYKNTPNSNNIYGTIVERNALCQGYSEAFYECMCRVNNPPLKSLKQF